MAESQRRVFDLPDEDIGFIDRQVASGAYASDNEVVLAGIEVLRERDEEMELWLRKEVLPVVDAMTADPSRGIPLRTVMKNLREHHRRREEADPQ